MIAIPNMEKPKECKKCKFCIVEAKVEEKIYPLHAYCFVQHQNLKDFDECPLIEIDQEAIDIAQDIMDGCKRFKERRADETQP